MTRYHKIPLDENWTNIKKYREDNRVFITYNIKGPGYKRHYEPDYPCKIYRKNNGNDHFYKIYYGNTFFWDSLHDIYKYHQDNTIITCGNIDSTYKLHQEHNEYRIYRKTYKDGTDSYKILCSKKKLLKIIEETNGKKYMCPIILDDDKIYENKCSIL